MKYLLLLLASSAAMAKPMHTTIVGGVTATAGEMPFIVGLRDDYYQEPFCDGSLIAKNWVLTAAHCVQDQKTIHLDVGLYQLSDKSSVETFDSTEFYVHPNYNPDTSDSDFALIHLPSDSSVTPVVMNAEEIAIPKSVDEQLMATVAGWGMTSEKDYSTPDILLKVTVPLIDQVTCAAAYESSGYPVTDTMICAGEMAGGKDACQGDSGGPLVTQNADMSYKLVGIVSWGVGCARPNLPGVYSKVNAAYSWIQDTMAAH